MNRIIIIGNGFDLAPSGYVLQILGLSFDSECSPKESNITNNPNDWAKEVRNPRYILDLLLSFIKISVQTVEIVASLPKINFE